VSLRHACLEYSGQATVFKYLDPALSSNRIDQIGRSERPTTPKTQKTMKKYQNHSETKETFITDDGNVVKYQDVFKGIEAQTRYYASKNRKNYDNGDADDVFQDAAYRAVAYHSGYNSDKSKPRTYGSMIANSCARDAYRSDMRRAMIFTSLESEFEFEDDGYKAEKCMYNEYKDDEFGADCTIRENEASKYIEGKIATLRRDYQTANQTPCIAFRPLW